MNYQQLGKHIRRFRKKSGFTQAYLAELVDTSPGHISHIERGKTKPSLELTVKIANALHASMDELLLGSLDNDGAACEKRVHALISECTPEQREMVLDILKLICEYKE